MMLGQAERYGERMGTGGIIGGMRTANQGTDASWQPIFRGIMDAIMRHRLAPGARLAEEELAEIYGVSRTVVRAALQVLTRDGVVIMERNKGARVAQPTPVEAREIFEARAVIEPTIARLATARMNPDAAMRLRASIEAEHRALHADRLTEAIFHSAEFHRILATLSGHQILGEMLDELLSRSSLVVALYWRQPDAPCDNHDHLALVAALEGGDGERAASLMREHVATLLETLDLSCTLSNHTGLSAALKPC